MREQYQTRLIHIGFPKTASTTLQRCFFNQLERFSVIGRTGYRPNNEVERVIQAITDSETLEFDPIQIAGMIEVISKGNELIVSEESLSTGSSLPGRVSRHEIANRLSLLFPGSRVLVIIREQRSMIKSIYLQQRKFHRSNKMGFNEWFQEQIKYKNMGISNHIDVLKYDNLVRLYYQLFGEENVHVLPFELLKTNPKEFYWIISKILGYDEQDDMLRKIIVSASQGHENMSLSSRRDRASKLIEILAFCKPFLPEKVIRSVKNFLDSGKKLDVTLTRSQEDLLCAAYAESNVDLFNMLAFCPQEYGYHT